MHQKQILKKLQDNLLEVINVQFTHVLENESQIELEKPRDPEHGDWATNIAMQLAKQLQRNPREIATEIKQALEAKELEELESIEVAGPGFINFKLTSKIYLSNLQEILEEKENFGKNTELSGKSILIEHTSPNPTKEFHLGHLKNNVTGLAVSYILEAQGAKIYRDCIDNNRGIAVARLMWGYLAYAKTDDNLPTDIDYWYEHQDQWRDPNKEDVAIGEFIDNLYTRASEAFKTDENVEQTIRRMVVLWEAGDEKQLALWRLTQTWVWQGFEETMKRVDGWYFDKIWRESDIYQDGKRHVYRGLEEGIFRQLDDGAILTDLKKEFGLTDTILIKNDGTSLYITQDLELTYQKRETFNPDEMIWCIGPEQSLAMRQMFAVCSQLGFGDYKDFHHLPYGFVLVANEQGEASKMSSRDGTQISVNRLLDRAANQIKQLITNEDLTATEQEQLAEKVAVGAVKYSLLKVSRNQDMVFDFNKTVALEGDSGPYLLYTYARAKAILRKSEQEVNFTELQTFTEVEEAILKQLSLFPNIIQSAARDYAPNYIAAYLYDLAQIYNNFYNKYSVLHAETAEQVDFRLALTKATAQVLHNGLNLLGIETVEKM